MALLVDVDAIAKLAHWGLLEDLPSLTGESWDTISTIGSLRYRAQRASSNPDGKLFRCTGAALAVLAAIGRMSDLPEVSADDLSIFQDISGIDVGEAILLATLGNDPQRRLLTGDKRALRSLSEQAVGTRTGFAQRIIVIEQVVLCALDVLGIEELRERICRIRGLDKAIDISMGSRCDASEEAVRTGLRSYIIEMRELCAPSLLANWCRANAA